MIKKDLYYTKEHEWIDFQGAIAYLGVSNFKLTGFKAVEELSFSDPSGFKKKGELIATIKYHDYLIEVKMPVDGKIMETNPLFDKDPTYLIKHAETSGWIALIALSQPFEREGLIVPKLYQMNGKDKYAK